MIIGITGTIGSGKSAVAQRLIDKHGFQHFSARVLLSEELERRSEPLDRIHLLALANEWRAEHGPDHIARRLLERAAVAPRAVIESLRTAGEADLLHDAGGVLWAVDAPSRLRFDRVIQRRSQTDNIAYEEFLENERAEAEQTDLTRSNIPACMREADLLFVNDEGLEKLHAKVDLSIRSVAPARQR